MNSRACTGPFLWTCPLYWLYHVEQRSGFSFFLNTTRLQNETSFTPFHANLSSLTAFSNNAKVLRVTILFPNNIGFNEAQEKPSRFILYRPLNTNRYWRKGSVASHWSIGTVTITLGQMCLPRRGACVEKPIANALQGSRSLCKHHCYRLEKHGELISDV